MHIDSRNLPANAIIEGDICIIGAGAAGISIALDWIHSGHKVILLEAGGFEYEDRVQDMYKGNATGQKYYPLRSTRLHYFGGTTGHWAGMCSPYDPIDFVKRDWVPESGWPITRKDLDPFYARAHEKLKLGPYEYDLSYWQKEVPNLTPFPLDPNVIWNKMWQFSQARFGSLYKDTITKAQNILLYTYANVVNIIANEGVSEIQEVLIKNYTGKTHKVRAKQFILAGGAIQNARLLLASNTQAPRGLGNNYDIVGRYFMEHIEITSAELWLFKPIVTDLYTWKFNETRARAELAITEKAQAENKILNGTASLNFGHLALSSMEAWQNEDPRKARDNSQKVWDEVDQASLNKHSEAIELYTRIEQSPNPNSRVTIGSDRDELGVPLANLHWELTELDKRSIRKIYHLIGKQMGIAGLGRVKLLEFLRDENDNSWPVGTSGGWHHMGTTRMSNDPRKGVVDANCQVHGLSNLYVAGAGCYPTSGAANPTLTLVSLSLRLSDYVKERLKS